MKHEHKECEHIVAFCKVCDLVYCEDCDQTWEEPCTRSHNDYLIYSGSPTTITDTGTFTGVHNGHVSEVTT